MCGMHVCVSSGRSVIWGPLEIFCDKIESQGMAMHFFESLWTFGCALGMGGQHHENACFQMKNRKTCVSAKTDKKFLSVE